MAVLFDAISFLDMLHKYWRLFTLKNGKKRNCSTFISSYSSIVKHAILFFIPSFFCCSIASRPRKGMSDFSLHVKARPASNGESSARKSACQCLYPAQESESVTPTYIYYSDILWPFLHKISIAVKWVHAAIWPLIQSMCEASYHEFPILLL